MISKILKYLNNLNIRQVLILAGIAAAMMFASIYIFFSRYTAKEVEQVKAEKEEVQVMKVVVAKTDIAPRLKIREDMLEVKDLPIKDVPSGAITSKEEILDLPAKISILAGDVITSRKLYKSTNQTGFVGTIPPDCRAISIQVNDITGVAGFAKPGDYVDLLLVENNATSATSNIILQNVLLLSINQTMDRNEVDKEEETSKKEAIDNPSIVTVALRPEEALKLVSASKLGDIYLMLRPAIPLETYVEGMEYQVISANAPREEPKKEETEEKSEPEQDEKEKIEKKIEIIEGDQFFKPEEAEKK